MPFDWFEQLLTFQFILDKEQCNLRLSGDLILNRMIVVAVCCVLHILVGSKGHSSYICLSFGFFPKSPPAQGLRQYEEHKYSANQGEAAHDDEGQGQPDAGKGGLFSQLLSLVWKTWKKCTHLPRVATGGATIPPIRPHKELAPTAVLLHWDRFRWIQLS